MAAFNAFARFGHVSFSGKKLPAQRIYEALKRAMGPAFDDSFNGSHTQAKLFAWSMGIASAALMLDRVKNNAIAKKATDLLPNLERQYGLKPGRDDSKIQRRARLHARQQVSRGATYEAIWDIMNSLLGAEFEDWMVATAATIIRFPDAAGDADDQANFVPAGTQARVVKATETCFPGSQTVAVEELTDPTGDTSVQAMIGRPILVDPTDVSRRERVTISAVTTDANGKLTSITATFAKVHEVGTHLTTQHFPIWRSTAQFHFFQVALAAATDQEKRRLVNEELSRSMKSVATWNVGTSGSFAPDTGLVGITPIGEVEGDPSAPIKAIFGADNLVAYWGAHATDFKQDTSGNGNHLQNVGPDPGAYAIDGSMGGVAIANGEILQCDSIASIASGTDKPFTVVFWGQWGSDLSVVWRFYKSDDDAIHGWTMAAGHSVYRNDDDGNIDSDTIATINTSQRFFGHAFAGAGSANNVQQVDATVINPTLNENPTTFDRFRIGIVAAGVRIARMVVLDRAATEAELASLRSHWVAQAAWNT